MVITCLTMGVLSSISHLQPLLSRYALYLEIVMIVWVTIEFVIRMWSAGCRSRYQGLSGRLHFLRKPLCVIDTVLILASLTTLVAVGTTQESYAVSVLSGLRFFQILRMVRMDRRGGTWKLLGSVVWAHRQELVTTLYIGTLGLIFTSYLVYLAERHQPRPPSRDDARDHVDKDTTKSTPPPKFSNFADALWWGVVTLCTVGYGDVVPTTWAGKVIASFSAVLGISFFALPAGILGSGFALKVQQQQRQKHLNRRRVPAAELIQCLWRCYAADIHSVSVATWKPHLVPCPSPSADRPWKNNTSFVSRFSSKRRDRDRDKAERWAHNTNTTNTNTTTNTNANASGGSTAAGGSKGDPPPSLPHSTSPRGSRHSTRRSAIFSSAGAEEEGGVHVDRPGVPHSTGFSEFRQMDLLPVKKESSVSSICKDSEEEQELSPRMTQLTESDRTMIRALRKIRYFVARRKFREALRPYDVKDVIEQYSAGHVDMLGRIKNLQGRLDQILGRQGSKSKDVYESNICLASRIVKAERQVEDVESKLDLLIDMYKEDRKILLQHILQQQQQDQTGTGPSSSSSSTLGPGAPPAKPRPILVDKQFTSEPATPTGPGLHPSRPMQRNLSDLSQRIKKRVTYRCLSLKEPPKRSPASGGNPGGGDPASAPPFPASSSFSSFSSGPAGGRDVLASTTNTTRLNVSQASSSSPYHGCDVDRPFPVSTSSPLHPPGSFTPAAGPSSLGESRTSRDHGHNHHHHHHHHHHGPSPAGTYGEHSGMEEGGGMGGGSFRQPSSSADLPPSSSAKSQFSVFSFDDVVTVMTTSPGMTVTAASSCSEEEFGGGLMTSSVCGGNIALATLTEQQSIDSECLATPMAVDGSNLPAAETTVGSSAPAPVKEAGSYSESPSFLCSSSSPSPPSSAPTPTTITTTPPSSSGRAESEADDKGGHSVGSEEAANTVTAPESSTDFSVESEGGESALRT